MEPSENILISGCDMENTPDKPTFFLLLIRIPSHSKLSVGHYSSHLKMVSILAERLWRIRQSQLWGKNTLYYPI